MSLHYIVVDIFAFIEIFAIFCRRRVTNHAPSSGHRVFLLFLDPRVWATRSRGFTNVTKSTSAELGKKDKERIDKEAAEHTTTSRPLD